jgi:hypothetical protein
LTASVASRGVLGRHVQRLAAIAAERAGRAEAIGTA